MSSLLESADLFETSSRLESASGHIASLCEGHSLDARGRQALRWAGELLMRVDWMSSDAWSSSKASPDMATRATAVRPQFFDALVLNRDDFAQAGLKSTKDVCTFLEKLYTFLNSGGETIELDMAQLSLAADFLHDIAQAVLITVDRNGNRSESAVFSQIV